MMSKLRIAIFASGKGSNADKICQFFTDHQSIEVGLIVSNKSDAGVSKVAEQHQIPFLYIENKALPEGDTLLDILTEYQIDFIALAGFLRKIPESMIDRFEHKIVNIHPALLPKFGGKGMYGHHVHKAVIDAGDKESGITIHLVNKEYDKGRILFQAQCKVLPNDGPEDLARSIHVLEHEYYPRIIEQYLLSLAESTS